MDQQLYSVGEAARRAGMTPETLRHYDRIGLVSPSRRDSWTSYRYYSEEEIVCLQTVRALQQMDIPLLRIKEILQCNSLPRILDFLTEAEAQADEQIDRLRRGKEKIHAARADYERKLRLQKPARELCVRVLPRRMILLSRHKDTPSLETLQNVWPRFAQELPPQQRCRFAFEDVAGVYTQDGVSRLFVQCLRWEQNELLRELPAGRYLCLDCTEEQCEAAMAEMQSAACRYGCPDPRFILRQVMVAGVLAWTYQLQICLEASSDERFMGKM